MNERKPLAASVSFFFSLFMLAIYVLLIVLLIGFQWPPDLPASNRIILATAIAVYLVYRVYRMMKNRKEEKPSNGN